MNAINSAVINLYTKGISHIAAAGNQYFNGVADNIENAIDAAIPYVWIFAALAFIGVGLMCIIGSERSKEQAKSKAVYIIAGVGIIVCAVYLGKFVMSMFGSSYAVTG